MKQKRYIAKTYPTEETIQEHTNRLLENYDILKRIYPYLKIDWGILELSCLYHDLGKMNDKFQRKLKGKKVKNEIPHGFLSTGFLNIKQLRKRFSREKIKILVNAIAYHHERDFNFSEYGDLVAMEIQSMQKEAEGFVYDKIHDCRVYKLPSIRYLDGSRVTEKDGEDIFHEYILIKGLLNRIDYASSAHEEVERENDFLELALHRMMERWKVGDRTSSWNELQRYMMKNRERNVIAIAQTGMGKTEAGLLWIGNRKGFFTLPLKTAINAIYDRVRTDIVKEGLEDRVGLLHSDTFSEYIKREYNEKNKLELEEIGISRYYQRTRQLTMPLTICTIDQLFDFIYRYRGFESKLATLAYSKLVIDEIQMYSSDLIAYLVSGLAHITRLGGKFTILTATFPPFIGDLLEAEDVEFIKPEPFIDKCKAKIRHSTKVKDDIINADFVMQKYNKNKVLVICNTVKKAQELYEEILEKDEEFQGHINLFHSSFIRKDRLDKEEGIINLGSRGNKEGYGIWICTQVVEASLDIDFDILITELSDLNGLFQRMGRCYRNRAFDRNGYNCYVFNGGNRKCTGVGYVIDKDIFKFSKEALKGMDGRISEGKKINLINKLYTTEILKNTKYYIRILNILDYIKSLYTNEMDKTKAKRMFRNINTITVIPENIFVNNEEQIVAYKEIINKKWTRYMTKQEKEKLKVEKAKARSKFMDYTVSIPFYLINDTNVQNFEISKYENIKIFKCEYDKEMGVIPVKELVKEKEMEEWDNFF